MFSSTPTSPSTGRGSERGATLTGYALTMAVMVVVALGSMSALETNSEDFLENTGDKIGEPRESAQVAVSNAQQSYGNGNSTGNGAGPPATVAPNVTTPSTTPSTAPPSTSPPSTSPPSTAPDTTVFTDGSSGSFFSTKSDGTEYCIQPGGSGAEVQDCNNGSGSTFVEKTNASGDIFMAIGDQCLTRGSGNNVSLATCDNTNTDQMWSPNGSGQYVNASDPGRCLDVAGGLGSGNDLITWSCHSGENQKFTLGTPTPPAPTPVLEAPASYSYNGSQEYLGDPSGAVASGISSTVSFVADGAGTYRLEFEILDSGDGSQDSFHVDYGAGVKRYNTLNNVGSSTWQTAGVAGGDGVTTIEITLAAGETFDVTIYPRENGVAVGSVRIVPVP